MAATASTVNTRQAVRDAADALLMDGIRPSVKVIRTRLGRGSDTTIAAALTEWWKDLGQRLAGLQSRPDVPEAVWTAADALWAAALDAAQQALAADRKALETDRKKAEAQIEAALQRQAQAEREAEKLEKALAEVREAMRQVDTARAREAARAEAVVAQRDDLQARLAKAEKAAITQAQQFERRHVEATERFDRSEQRLLAQIDSAKSESKQLRGQLSEQAKQARAAEAAAAQALTAARTDNAKLRQQIEVKDALLLERERAMQTLSAQLEARTGEVASFKAQLDHAQREDRTNRKENESLAKAAKADAACIQQLREHVVELQTRLELDGRVSRAKKPRSKKTNQSS